MNTASTDNSIKQAIIPELTPLQDTRPFVDLATPAHAFSSSSLRYLGPNFTLLLITMGVLGVMLGSTLVMLLLIPGEFPEAATGGLFVLGIGSWFYWMVKVVFPYLLPMVVTAGYGIGSTFAGTSLTWVIIGPVSYSRLSGWAVNDAWITYRGNFRISLREESDARRHCLYTAVGVVLSQMILICLLAGSGVTIFVLLAIWSDAVPLIIDVPLRTLGFVNIGVTPVLLFLLVKSLRGQDLPLLSLLREGDEHRTVQRRMLETRIEQQGGPNNWNPADIQALMQTVDDTFEGATTAMVGYWYHIGRGGVKDAEWYLNRALTIVEETPVPYRRFYLETLPTSFFDEAAFIAAYYHHDLVGAMSLLNRAREEAGAHRFARLRAEAAVQWLCGDAEGSLERLRHAFVLASNAPFPDTSIEGARALVRSMISGLEQSNTRVARNQPER